MLKRYKDWKPSAHDASGLNLPDHQEWFVCSCTQNRDSTILEESNFAQALKYLGGESETVEVHRFGHWACGWFEIIIVNPSREPEVTALEAKLENYPVLSDDDLSERESKEAYDWFIGYERTKLAEEMGRVFGMASDTIDFLRYNASAEDMWELHCKYTDNSYEVNGNDIKYDFSWVERSESFGRGEMAAFIKAQRKAQRDELKRRTEGSV